MGRKFTDEELQRVVDASYGRTQWEAARLLNLPRSTMISQLEAAKRRNLSPSRAAAERAEGASRALERQLEEFKREALGHRFVREKILELAAYDPRPPEWLSAKTLPAGAGVPVLCLSDLHWGERVFPAQVFNLNKYDLEIARARLAHVTQTAVRLLREHVHPNSFESMVLWLGGDLITGEIHEELAETNAVAVGAAALDCFDNLVAVIKTLREFTEHLYVIGTPGNHGRMTRKPRFKMVAERNWDWVLCQLLERHFRGDDGVVFNCPAAADVSVDIAGHRFRFTHGDQFHGGDGHIGVLGPIIRGGKRKRAAAASMPAFAGQDFRYLVMGHFHTEVKTNSLIANGTLKGYDEYAAGNNFEYEPPSQTLFITHPRIGIPYYMPIIAEQRKG